MLMVFVVLGQLDSTFSLMVCLVVRRGPQIAQNIILALIRIYYFPIVLLSSVFPSSFPSPFPSSYQYKQLHYFDPGITNYPDHHQLFQKSPTITRLTNYHKTHQISQDSPTIPRFTIYLKNHLESPEFNLKWPASLIRLVISATRLGTWREIAGRKHPR